VAWVALPAAAPPVADCVLRGALIVKRRKGENDGRAFAEAETGGLTFCARKIPLLSPLASGENPRPHRKDLPSPPNFRFPVRSDGVFLRHGAGKPDRPRELRDTPRARATGGTAGNGTAPPQSLAFLSLSPNA
jgi:hypothetical protein